MEDIPEDDDPDLDAYRLEPSRTPDIDEGSDGGESEVESSDEDSSTVTPELETNWLDRDDDGDARSDNDRRSESEDSDDDRRSDRNGDDWACRSIQAEGQVDGTRCYYIYLPLRSI